MVACLLLVSHVYAQPPVPPAAKSRDEAIDRIEKLGGTVRKVTRRSGALEVDLQGSTVTDSVLQDLALLENVQVLRLKKTVIGDAGLTHVAKLAGLKRLFLDQTAVTDAGLSRLAELKGLEFLCLYGTAVSDAGLDHLNKLPSLKTVVVTESKVTAAGSVAFQKANPRIRLVPDVAAQRQRAQAAWKIARAALENAQAELEAAKKKDAELTPKIEQLKAEAEAANKKAQELEKQEKNAKKISEEANKKANELKKKSDELQKFLLKNPDDAAVKKQVDQQSGLAEGAANEASVAGRRLKEARAAYYSLRDQAKAKGQLAGRAQNAKKRAEEAQKRLDSMRKLEEYNRTISEQLGKQ